MHKFLLILFLVPHLHLAKIGISSWDSGQVLIHTKKKVRFALAAVQTLI